MNSYSSLSRSSIPRILLFAASCALLGLAARAQEPRPPERGRDGEREGGFARMNPLFAALDANGDGVIDEEELKNATAALKKLDRNHDGKLTEEEVRPAFGRGGPGGQFGRGGPGGPGERGGPGGVNPEEMVNRMMQFDKDGDGRLSKEELPERMQRMMERGDTNKDGFLSKEELMELARAQAGAGGRGEGREREGDRR